MKIIATKKIKLVLILATFLFAVSFGVFTQTKKVSAATEGVFLEYTSEKTFPTDNVTNVKEIQMDASGDTYSKNISGLSETSPYLYKIKVVASDGTATYYPTGDAYTFSTIAKSSTGGPSGNGGNGGNGNGNNGGNGSGNSGSTFPAVATFVGKVDRLILNPLIILMFAAALLYFLYGMLQFVMNAQKAEARETGKSHMVWGLTGMLIMFGVFVLLNIVMRTIGTSNPNIPTSSLIRFFV